MLVCGWHLERIPDLLVEAFVVVGDTWKYLITSYRGLGNDGCPVKTRPSVHILIS